MGIHALIKQHPILFYYLFVFAISWGGILLLIGGPGNIPAPKEEAEKLFVSALLIMFSGPFISGILMSFLTEGKAGLHTLISRLLNWRVNIRWIILAVLIGPILVSIVLFTLSLFSKDYLPGLLTTQDKIGFIIFGVSWGLAGGGLFEETGWTGFAIPRPAN